jgi:hypothetical protein
VLPPQTLHECGKRLNNISFWAGVWLAARARQAAHAPSAPTTPTGRLPWTPLSVPLVLYTASQVLILSEDLGSLVEGLTRLRGREQTLTMRTCNKTDDGSRSLTACRCEGGYSGLDGAECIACIPGKYKSAAGSYECNSCPEGITHVQVCPAAFLLFTGTKGADGADAPPPGKCVSLADCFKMGDTRQRVVSTLLGITLRV